MFEILAGIVSLGAIAAADRFFTDMISAEFLVDRREPHNTVLPTTIQLSSL